MKILHSLLTGEKLIQLNFILTKSLTPLDTNTAITNTDHLLRS